MHSYVKGLERSTAKEVRRKLIQRCNFKRMTELETTDSGNLRKSKFYGLLVKIDKYVVPVLIQYNWSIGSFGVHHFEYYSKAISETCYRSDFVYLSQIESFKKKCHGKTFADFVVERTKVLHEEHLKFLAKEKRRRKIKPKGGSNGV